MSSHWRPWPKPPAKVMADFNMGVSHLLRRKVNLSIKCRACKIINKRQGVIAGWSMFPASAGSGRSQLQPARVDVSRITLAQAGCRRCLWPHPAQCTNNVLDGHRLPAQVIGISFRSELTLPVCSAGARGKLTLAINLPTGQQSSECWKGLTIQSDGVAACALMDTDRSRAE